MSYKVEPRVNALAEAWASIDGKLDYYRRERDEEVDLLDPTCTGHFAGYEAEAQEMIRRLEARGFTVTPLTGNVRHG